QYAINSQQFVVLKVYDVLGNEIATLVNEEKAAGTYEIMFDAQVLPSGVYFYKLEAGSFIETKKMIFLR
ncbi:MAG: T9SS type A sorting domain-containing protein, partial [Bacteroidetes bacterium]|nr:T9SS type A sorting domain-containing protein [Bacteroidota bacterium]